MKKFLILLALLVGLIVWFRDWVSTGRMDNFIRQHKHTDFTPKILYLLSQFHTFSQNPKYASYYYRWFIEDYPTHIKIPEMRWQLGRSYEEMNQRNLALEQYTVLKDSYTNTEQGRLAMNRYGRLRY